MADTITVGVLALQGGFSEHLALLGRAAAGRFSFVQVRSREDLARCQALVIPGGESTTMSLVAGRLGLLEPLRQFVKAEKRPTWGTCAGLIMLAEEASAAKAGGQELIGGLDVRVRRNHFGRQVESFETDLRLPFLGPAAAAGEAPFRAVFIRAPVVEEILIGRDGGAGAEVEVLAVLPQSGGGGTSPGDVVAVRQANVFGTSFHPELTGDLRIHAWWLGEVEQALGPGRGGGGGGRVEGGEA